MTPLGTRAGRAAALGLLLSCAACGADDGEGSVRVVAYGEAFVEQGIDDSTMEDGWSIAFERFEVSVSDVVVAGVPVPVTSPVDLVPNSGGEGHGLGSAPAPAGRHQEARFTVERVEVAGTASRAEVEKRFEWTLDRPTRYERCETTTHVRDVEQASFEITVHADHLFYDSLVAEEPALRFQSLADADENADGEVAPDELSRADLGPYDPGSEGGVDDLWAWLLAATGTLGHVDGEGHCNPSPVAGPGEP